MTKFVQAIEFTTTHIDEFNEKLDDWLTATAGKRTALHGMETKDRDRADTYMQMVEFPSYAEAMRNSELPETARLAEEMTRLCEGPAVFRNLDMLREDDMSDGQAQTLLVKNLGNPDETRPFEAGSGRMDMVETPHGPVGRAVFEPGWRWSQHVKPIAGTDSCQTMHAGYCLSGRMRIHMDDGTENDVGPGDFMFCPPGHDAWVLGDEACVLIDWAGAAHYAKRG
ncbi:cupin domain-containing protein [Nocardia nova SH22a]|uniref:Cupin domain-containing protein n=1 Tax=Nocardia nova SH22a TaxID=1415166 RepID=W5TPI7_9NOCA|nr:cupin domain-containing protein [Nocardia nova]AHH19161.1 cupin domain-containing protein [Nocardia nova SH22a]